MKELLKKLGRQDEMQRQISCRAQQYAYYFLFAALFLWTVYESLTTLWFHHDLNLIPCFLMVGASLIQGFSELIMQRNAVKDDDEYQSAQPLFKIILLACAAAAVSVTVMSIVTMLVVRL